jgi:hypothetical protein
MIPQRGYYCMGYGWGILRLMEEDFICNCFVRFTHDYPCVISFFIVCYGCDSEGGKWVVDGQ